MDLELQYENSSKCLSRNESGCGESASSGLSTALASVLIFTIVVDILGNVLVILSVYRNKKLRNAGNIFVVSLSVADLVVALYPYPLVLTAIFHNDWTMGDLHCQASGFIMGLSVIGSIFNITAIAINRYCYICHSLHYDRLYSLRNTCCYLGLTWLLTALATVPNFFVGSLQYDPRIYSCTFTQTVSSYYTISVVVIHFLIPVLVVSYCYLRIWVLVIQVKQRVKPDQRPKLKPSDVRNFLMMFMVFVLFAVCWAPLNLIGLACGYQPRQGGPQHPRVALRHELLHGVLQQLPQRHHIRTAQPKLSQRIQDDPSGCLHPPSAPHGDVAVCHRGPEEQTLACCHQQQPSRVKRVDQRLTGSLNVCWSHAEHM
ncbi:hypothetical protein fugu_013192 [Takifugu bimaculatus]|uniref:G-protein coupled receptors family 1 profile domain-containing protein n=1 Tax=Takifugu bimaculatus TaxID=433685 RepID=A0A4Z2C3M6_9TELE|nr:hypothetical protein fugu_013192 [Takifugu bimaculatus]